MLMDWPQTTLLATFSLNMAIKVVCVTPLSDKPGENL